MSGRCSRCRQEVKRATLTNERFQVHLEDRSDSTFVVYDLALCVRCWENLLDFLGQGSGWAPNRGETA